MTATEAVPQTTTTDLVFPCRYYCRFPFEEPRGYQEEQQCMARAQTAFMLVDVYGLGYGDGEPEPEYPTLFLRKAFEREREIVRAHIRPALDAARLDQAGSTASEASEASSRAPRCASTAYGSSRWP